MQEHLARWMGINLPHLVIRLQGVIWSLLIIAGGLRDR